jgi:formylglycine-generating enzyme required for sulfatase activity/tRNA A-37 threonylcarbamoyl transferase component Bud32
MKSCPNCSRTYADDLQFCPHDAAQLTATVTATEVQLAAGLSRRFRIVRRLGAGGMGTVFLAEQLGVGNRPVALKVLSRKLLDDPEFLLRFQNEAASAGRIRQANVVTIYESGQADDGAPYIAMEYLEGESLREALARRGALPVAECAEILQQTARGLNAAHKLGIIHRDLKPDNIFLTHGDEGELVVKVVDFGIAKLRDSASHTMTGIVVGTPAYMSYEQAFGMRSEDLDPRSDIYSLGVVVYEIITGRVPFHSDTPQGYLRKHLMDQPPPFRAVAPSASIPSQIEVVVLKALAKNRDQRFASAHEFAREFAGAASAIPTTGSLATTVLVDSAQQLEAEQLRLAGERAEAERREQRKAEQERLARERAEAEHREKEKAEAERLAREKAEQERLARERAEAERREKEKVEAERLARENAVQDRVARERLAALQRDTAKSIRSNRIKLVLWILGCVVVVGYLLSHWIHRSLADNLVALLVLIVLIALDERAWLLSQWRARRRHFVERKATIAKSGRAAKAARLNPKDGLKYVWIPPGTFLMGCSPGDRKCAESEKPPRQVTISKGFWLGQTPVTVAAYKRFATATGRQMPTPPRFNTGWINDDMPIVNVTWNDARDYCAWAGGRLPSEAEWEYAARGGSTEACYGKLDEIAWYKRNTPSGTQEVARKRANAFGLFDTLGNAWEWVADWFDANYYRYGAPQDPPGPENSTFRVLRGGCYGSEPKFARVSLREGYAPDKTLANIGFRCAGDIFGPG